MKKALASLLLLVATVCMGQTVTPNLGLILPPTNATNWGVITNRNMDILDTAFGSNFEAYQGTWLSTTTYSKGVLVSYLGNLYASNIVSNLNNNPVSSGQWTEVVTTGSSVTWPASADLVISNGSNSPTGLAPVNGDCVIGSAGAWAALPCGSSISNLIPVENYGAVGYASTTLALAGTDSTTAIQSCLNALTPGQACLISKTYKITTTLTMPTTTGIGLVGWSPSSALITTSSSADKIDDHGTSLTVRNTYHTYANFQTYRSVAPSGSAAGISQQYTGGTIINGVINNDDIHPFYYLAAAAYGYGYTSNSEASWGYNGLSTIPGCGFYLDTSTGVAMDSFRARNITASQNYGNSGNYNGVCLIGTLMSDVDIDGLETGVLTHSVDIEGSGSAQSAFQDIHFHKLVLDECLGACIYVTGIPNSGTYNYSAIEFSGGYLATDNILTWGYPNYAIDVENSSGITFTGLQVLGSDVAGFYLNGSNNITITGNNCKSGLSDGAHGGCLLLNGSNHNSITGNIFNSVVDVAGTNAKFVNSSFNTFQSNQITGTNALGVSFDSGSNDNLWLQANSLDSALDAQSTDAGTGNELSSGGLTDPGANGLINRTALNTTAPATGHTVAAVALCADTSGSGTAQTCTTSPTFTPVSGDWIIYSTTTANTGTGLTLNVNSLGAKSVAKWQGTTTLTAGDVAASKPVLAMYDGTNWELSTIGNAPTGTGGPSIAATSPILVNGGAGPVSSGTAIVSCPSCGSGGGSGLTARTVSGTTDTLTSYPGYVTNYTSSSAVAVAIAAGGSLTAGFSTAIWQQGAGAVTVTPASGTINGASTLVLAQGERCLIYIDSDATDLDGSCVSGLVNPDGTTVTASRNAQGETFSASGGGSGNFANLGASLTWTGCTYASGACTVGASAVASITISAIPGTYLNLKTFIDDSTTASSQGNIEWQFNGDTNTGHYSYQQSYSTGGSGGDTNSSSAGYIYCGATSFGTTIASSSECTISDYSGSVQKMITGQGVTPIVATSSIGALVGVQDYGWWLNTAAITSITLTPSSGSFEPGTTISIYGTN